MGCRCVNTTIPINPDSIPQCANIGQQWVNSKPLSMTLYACPSSNVCFSSLNDMKIYQAMYKQLARSMFIYFSEESVQCSEYSIDRRILLAKHLC